MSSKKYCRLCRKKETREQCSYGPRLYDKYSVDDATEKETAAAAVESGISENDIKNFSNIIIEKSKSGDSSLRDWFSKSRSSDGKPGWVQLGGKYAGKPCAKQPGQTTKPKCGSSKMKRNLDKGEEEAAFRRKQREDPNPNRKGKAINVKTEETILEGDYWHPDPEKDRQMSGAGNKARAREDGPSSRPAAKRDDSKKLRPGESYMDYNKRQKGYTPPKKKKSLLGKLGLRKEEVEFNAEGNKNCGCGQNPCLTFGEGNEKKRKNALQIQKVIGEKHDTPKNVKKIAKELDKAVEMHKSQAKRLRKAGISEDNLNEKCWKGYEKKGMKTMFGKRYPNCVKKEEFSDWRDELGYEGKDDSKKLQEDDMKGMSVKSGHKRPTKSGAGMTAKGVAAYRRRNPGSKLQTAVTGKVKKGSKDAKRRKSYCARSAGQMKKFPKAAKDPNSRLRQARRRWNC